MLETFSDSVFAIAVTLLALQLHPPNLTGATNAGAVLHALGQQLRPFGFSTLAFLLTGRLWLGVAQVAFVLVCLLVRREVAAGCGHRRVVASAGGRGQFGGPGVVDPSPDAGALTPNPHGNGTVDTVPSGPTDRAATPTSPWLRLDQCGWHTHAERVRTL